MSKFWLTLIALYLYVHPSALRKNNIRLVGWLKIGARGCLDATSCRLPSPCSAVQLLDGLPQ